jgi:hypothetical protein
VSDGFTFTIHNIVASPTVNYYHPQRRGLWYLLLADAVQDKAGRWVTGSDAYPGNLPLHAGCQDLTDTTPAFVWKAVAGASRYHLEVYDDEALSHEVFDFEGSGTTIAPLPAEGLNEGQHWWRMQVSRGGGFEEWTPAWTFTVTPRPGRTGLIQPTTPPDATRRLYSRCPVERYRSVDM